MGKRFLGLDGLKHFWSKAKTWILEQITTEVTSKIAEVVANAPEDFNTLKEIADWIRTHADDASAMNSQIIQNQNDIKSLQSFTDSVVVGVCPVGTILSGLYTTAPEGFLLCNGQEVAIADYFELYTVVGSLAECQSENEGMFKVPDLQGRFLEGANGNLGTVKEAGLPNITGNITAKVDGKILHWDMGSGATQGKDYAKFRDSTIDDRNLTGYQSMQFDASRSNSIYGKSNTVQPPALTVNYVIKY